MHALLQLITARTLVVALASTLVASTQSLAAAPSLDGVELVTEEVEPGVYRIVSDGVRDLTWFAEDGRSRPGDLLAGLDGSVWQFTGERFHRLGAENDHQIPGRRWQPKAISLDGTIWGTSRAEARPILRTFDGQRFAKARIEPRLDEYTGVAVSSDGAVWAAASAHRRHKTVVERLEPSGKWRSSDTGLDPSTRRAFGFGERGQLVGSPDGSTAFLLGRGRVARLKDFRNGRYVAELIDAPLRTPGFLHDGAVGNGGELWLLGDVESGERSLARLAPGDGEPQWEVFDWPAAMPDFWTPIVGGVDAQGAIWIFAYWYAGDCDGVYRFDGSSTTEYLRGTCPSSLAIAPDGTVWVHAAASVDPVEFGLASGSSLVRPSGRMDLFAIPPDAYR